MEEGEGHRQYHWWLAGKAAAGCRVAAGDSMKQQAMHETA